MMHDLLALPLLTAIPEEVWRKSPNFDDRPKKTISRLIVHSDASPNIGSLINYIQNPNAEKRVSYHVSFGAAGACYRHVDFAKRAWHALNNNADTIGLNLSNPQDGKTPYPLAQLDAAAAYVAWVILPAYPAINMKRILTHHVVDPSRKSDPYPNEKTYDHAVFLQRIEAYRATPKP